MTTMWVFALALLAVLTDAFWRLPCYSSLGLFRIDPIISPGHPSQHAHTLHGAQNLSFCSTYDILLTSYCTSCSVVQDKSAYWTPSLMFQDKNGSIEVVPQVNGMLIYYFLFGGAITAFPEGFRMVAGNSSRRTFTLPVPDPPQSQWNTSDKTQDALSQKALGFNCLNYQSTAEGALQRHFLPNKSFIDSYCRDGLRLELMFPSCWDGANVDSFDHESHLAYPDLVMDGDCPTGYGSRVPSLYYETIWDTTFFRDRDGRFLLSNGDLTGFGYHGDFLNGWDISILQNAVLSCTNLSGRVEDCEDFELQSPQMASQCNFIPPQEILSEDCSGPRVGLCGNVTITM